jgi:hypothetical protein
MKSVVSNSESGLKPFLSSRFPSGSRAWQSHERPGS